MHCMLLQQLVPSPTSHIASQLQVYLYPSLNSKHMKARTVFPALGSTCQLQSRLTNILNEFTYCLLGQILPSEFSHISYFLPSSNKFTLSFYTGLVYLEVSYIKCQAEVQENIITSDISRRESKLGWKVNEERRDKRQKKRELKTSL